MLFILEDLFYKSYLTTQYTLGNKIRATTLVNIYATKFGFIDKIFAKIIYQKLEIELQCLIKLKFIERFDD